MRSNGIEGGEHFINMLRKLLKDELIVRNEDCMSREPYLQRSVGRE
jgi:hypothetical protein